MHFENQPAFIFCSFKWSCKEIKFIIKNPEPLYFLFCLVFMSFVVFYIVLITFVREYTFLLIFSRVTQFIVFKVCAKRRDERTIIGHERPMWKCITMGEMLSLSANLLKTLHCTVGKRNIKQTFKLNKKVKSRL